MSVLRFLNWQGVAGVALCTALAALLLVQKAETRHWSKQSQTFEQLYREAQRALATTAANTRAAADAARAVDKANAERVAAGQRTISERISNDFERRLAAARALAEQLRNKPQAGAASNLGGRASMPRVSDAAGSPGQAANENRLPPSDALIATEQAIQLEELIKWVRRQAKVDNNPTAVATPQDVIGR